MFYKPFSTFKLKCQAAYSTQDIANSGKDLGKISDSYFAVFITAMVVFVVLFFCSTAHFKMSRVKSIVIHVLALVDLLAHTALIVFYVILTKLMSKVDLKMIQYLNDN